MKMVGGLSTDIGLRFLSSWRRMHLHEYICIIRRRLVQLELGRRFLLTVVWHCVLFNGTVISSVLLAAVKQ